MPTAIPTTPVESSNIAAIGYDAASKTLQVDFKTGKRYQYQNVPPELLTEFQQADSVGQYFAANIRKEFLSVPLTEDE